MRLFMSTAMGQTVTTNAPITQRFAQIDLPKSEHESIPISFAQERLWFLEKLEPNSPLYNLPTLVRITGRINVNALQRALNSMLARHEILRTRILGDQEMPSQVIAESIRLTLKRLDLSKGADPEGDAQKLISREIERPFNL